MDSNCIINNNVINESFDTIKYKIVFNIKSYFYDNKNINIVEYINQILWFHKPILNELFNIILNNIKKYIIHNRKIIRNSINNNNYDIQQLYEYIELFNNKIKYINILFKFNILLQDINFINKIYEYLYDYIINDPIIFNIIEKYILIQIEKNDDKQLEEYFKLLQSIYILELKYIYSNYIKSLTVIIYTNYIDKFNIYLPDNIKYISMLHNNITIIKKISTCYPYIYDDININLIEYLNINIINIIENNSIFEIYNIFQQDNINSILYLLKFNNEFIDKLTNLIFISENKDILYLYNFIDKLLNYTNNLNLLNLLYDKLYDKIYSILDNTELLNDIVFNIHIIIFNYSNKSNNNLLLTSKIIKSFSNNDIFNNIYIKYVKLRCLYYYKNFVNKIITKAVVLYKINNEIYILSLINIINIQLGIIIRNIVNDIQHSINYTISNIEPNINTIITSHYWNINDNGISIDAFDKNTILGKYIIDFNNTYVKNNNNERKLYWYLHYGNVEIIYLDKKIKMLPIHLILLNIICDNSFKLSDFKTDKFLNLYSIEFINNLLNSLLISKLIIIKNEILYMNENNNFNIDIINIFLTLFKEDIIENNDLSHSYKYIIMANINHILKSQTLHYNSLFNIIKKNNKLSLIDEKLFTDTLNYMVEMEYIMVNNLIYEKLYY